MGRFNYSEARDFYKENFYDNNDKAHMIDHADDVYANLKELVDSENLKVDDDVVFLTAYTHDIYTGINRGKHHELASKYALKRGDKYLELMNDGEIDLISRGVRNHRSSGNPKNRITRFEVLMAIADKGKLALGDMLKRSFSYNMSKNDKLSDIDVAGLVLIHMIDKFGESGYGYADEEYGKVYGREIEEVKKGISDLSINDIIKIVYAK